MIGDQAKALLENDQGTMTEAKAEKETFLKILFHAIAKTYHP